ncbi:YdcF family protein [Phenylobacterium deserti]|uniref:YdcF family protein n=1 Tax=Phenylobacterium deserti TaxID=1914756 RepID=A0A328AVB9_9CAUL|nr:YdcF family protein [Phenylobacterium deserti]RAK58111.1 YdcF family protein [Phenylobacterium deserti]
MRSVAAFLVLVLIWLAGLFAYAHRVQQSTPAPQPRFSQGIATLTGANSNERIAAAVGLLENGLGQRVLVSGVNREASREDIRTVSRAVRRLYDCCVDLGFTAADTVGNARETAEWAQAMRYNTLTIVTTDYHMPRAMLELRAVLPEPQYQLQSYAVPTPALKNRRWWRSPRAARLMVVEYSKYLAILGREAVLGLGPRETPTAAQAPGQQKD